MDDTCKMYNCKNISLLCLVVILAATLTDREMGFQADNAIFGNYEKTISKTTACTLGRKNVDTCQGDSGGPLVTRIQKGEKSKSIKNTF